MKQVSARIRFAGDCIELELPAGEGEIGHVVKFPLEKCSIVCNEWGSPLAQNLGWNALLSILKARYSDEHAQARSQIGRPSAPVQYDLEKMLKAVSITKVGRKSQAKEELTLEDLDL